MALTPEQQRDLDLSEIKVRVIDNAILVKLGTGWLSFGLDFTARGGAGEHIDHRIKMLTKKRQQAAGEKS